MKARVLRAILIVAASVFMVHLYAGFMGGIDPLQVEVARGYTYEVGRAVGFGPVGTYEISLRSFPTNCAIPVMRISGPLGYYRSLVFDRYIYGEGTWLPASGKALAMPRSGNGTPITINVLSDPAFPFVFPDRYRVVWTDLGEIYWVEPHGYYIVESPRPAYRIMVERWVPEPPQDEPHYLEVEIPEDLRNALMELISNVTAGIHDVEGKLRALERFLEENYEYDLSRPPAPMGEDPLEWFLFESRRGICVDFATAFVLMARLLGVPTRLVAGYYVTDEVVAQCDAHAWAESYIPGKGWVRFDPTPGRGPPPPAVVQAGDARPDEREERPTTTPPSRRRAEAPSPWWAMYAAVPVLAMAALYVALRPRVIVGRPPGVGDELLILSRCGSRLRLWGDVSGNGREIRVRLSRKGLWVIHAGCGPFRYRFRLRVVDYREEVARLYGKLLRRHYRGDPTAKTPREIAGEVEGVMVDLSLIAERVFYGGLRATRDIYERFRHV